MRARDALQESIYNQLTAARKSKARQVETYFRTIRNELSQLAASKMMVDAARDFRAAFDELDEPTCRSTSAARSATGTTTDFCPRCAASSAQEPNVNDYLPVGPAAYYLQYHYIVANPHPQGPAQAARRCRRRQRLQQAACHLPSAVAPARAPRSASSTLMLADPKSGRIVYSVAKEVDFGTSLRTGPYRSPTSPPPLPAAPPSPTDRRSAWRISPPTRLRGGAPIAFMAAPVIDQGVVIGVLIAQLSIEEIDNVVTGDRRWRQDGFGATGEAYLVGPDHFVRSGPRAFYENPRALFRRAEARRRAGREHRRHPPLRHAGAASARRQPRPRRPLSPASRAPARSSAIAASRRSPPGGRSRFPASSGR